MRDYKAIYDIWCSDPYFDEETKAELRAIADNDKEIRERFGVDLEFGTAGLRGVIGAGTNRMNKYVVRRATQGLANYILAQGGQDKGVAIAYDCRHMSPEFSDEAARTLAANGIKAYRFESLRPTPELSFAVRHLGCIAGINVTASHNPAEYNGYKVYWEDGAQFTPPHDQAVTREVLAITDMSVCKTMDREAAENAGLYINIGQEVDDAYMAEVRATILHPEAIAAQKDNISIVYTPLHGTGHVPVMRLLRELGFANVYEVASQAEPDGDFPTVAYPNPEAKEAFALALELAREKKADLVLATDPDADRLGVYVRNDAACSGNTSGNAGTDTCTDTCAAAEENAADDYIALNGNMSGALLCEYILSQRKAMGKLPGDGYVVESIVSTNLMQAVAQNYGCECKEVLTGFKWIGREILKSELAAKAAGNAAGEKLTGENASGGRYLFGMEESYGCLIGTYARDKDAVSAVASLCEAAAWYKMQGKSLWDVMQDMYARYGFFQESVQSFTFKGLEGMEKIRHIMDTLEMKTPAAIGGARVERIRNYRKEEILDFRKPEGAAAEAAEPSARILPTGLPVANVLYYDLENAGWVCVRPSGTEPKLKVYTGVRGSNAADAAAKTESLKEAVCKLVEEC